MQPDLGAEHRADDVGRDTCRLVPLHAAIERRLRSVKSFSVSTIRSRSPASSRANVISTPPWTIERRAGAVLRDARAGEAAVEPAAKPHEAFDAVERAHGPAFAAMRAVGLDDVVARARAAGDAGDESFELVELVGRVAGRKPLGVPHEVAPIAEHELSARRGRRRASRRVDMREIVAKLEIRGGCVGRRRGLKGEARAARSGARTVANSSTTCGGGSMKWRIVHDQSSSALAIVQAPLSGRSVATWRRPWIQPRRWERNSGDATTLPSAYRRRGSGSRWPS